MLDMGAIEQTIAKQAMLAGAPMPDRIANAPQLKLGLELYLQAFFDLDSERNNAMGPAHIPWSSKVKYAEHYGFDEEQTENLIFFVDRMDAAHLKRLAAKNKG